MNTLKTLNTLKPFIPDRERPWDRKRAAHLLRRAGFCPRSTEVQAALASGPSRTVARLVRADRDSDTYDEIDRMGERIALGASGDTGRLRQWWVLRACRTERPLHCRMALFWHDHFATSNAKVQNATLMLAQLRSIERHALGRFEDLLLAISRDPAMILWLDGDQNIRGRPNENYARELFELFTLGVGNYTEEDIREAARAFTGWHPSKGRFHFRAAEHDPGRKTVFGARGPFNGEDIVRLCVEHPACSRFIGRKLAEAFVSPQPPEELVEEIAALLRETDFDLAATLEVLLQSDALFDPEFERARIKSPMEYAMGIVRSLEMRFPAKGIEAAVSEMGQRLFEPPSVKGWDGHRAWLNSATMLVRLNAVHGALAPRKNQEGGGFQPARLRKKYGLNDQAAVLAYCINLVLDGKLPDALSNRLEALSGNLDSVMREALTILLTSPEYQMA